MLALLVRASVEGALFAAAVWMVCRLMPRLSPAVRTVLWWCVAAKFVVSFVWRSPIGVPVLPRATADTPVAGSSVPNVPSVSPAVPHDVASVATAAQMPRARSPRAALVRATDALATAPDGNTIPWPVILIGAWALGLGISLLQTARAWRQTRRAVTQSVTAHAPLRDMVRELASLLGLRDAPDIRVSADIASPLITGVRQPVILVPSDRFSLLSVEQQRMALCHELAHMKRGDVWLGFVPAVVERCFFFHPLARLAAREYAFCREAACDAAVLTMLGSSAQSYGRLLLALGVSRQPAPLSAAGAAWSFSNLKRRITMLSHPTSRSLRARVLAAGAVSLAIVALAPVKAVARTAAAPLTVMRPADGPSTAALVPVPAPTRQYTAPVVVPSAMRSVVPNAVNSVVPNAVNSVVPNAVDSVVPSQDRQAQELQFVYFSDDKRTTMSGSSGDVSRARRYYEPGEPMLWFRRDDQDYIVRDPRLLRDVEELWEPVNRIGAEQGELGARQGALGAEQGKHGSRQGEIGARQGVVGAKQGVVAARLGLLAAREGLGVSASDRREMMREREALDQEMRQLNREMDALGEEMRQFNPPMRELGEDMAKLGREMSELGKDMTTASKRANAGMRTLIDRAIRSGAAQAVR